MSLNSYKSLEDLIKRHPDKKLAIMMGNFDGVHLGHQDLINQALKECELYGLSLVILSFNPHPVCILKPDYKPFLLNTYEQKKRHLEQNRIEYFVEKTFTRDFSTQSPEDFLERNLLSYPEVSALYFGYDFAFGANKKGNYDFVARYCQDRVQVKKFDVFQVSDSEISSSLIRHSLRDSHVNEAKKFLGREFYLEGLVTKGEGRGKKIGFPTANLSFHKDLIVPQKGVYKTLTKLRGMNYLSITNIGVNPTFHDNYHLGIETHIFDFDDDLYGEVIQVHFIEFLREEKKFSSVNDLVEQIQKDCERARERD